MILQKELYFLIPFHIFAYEQDFESMNDASEKLEDLLQAYNWLSKVLQQKVNEGRLTEYERQVICDMTVKVANSLAAKFPKIKEGVKEIMGGAILELEVDKILNRGIDIGKTDGSVSTLAALVRDGLLDLAEGAKRANMSIDEFEHKVKEI